MRKLLLLSVFVLLPTNTLAALLTDSGWIAEGGQDGATLGNSVATAGDVNGDGYSDVIVSAYRYDAKADEGRVWLFHGSASGLSTTAAWVETGPERANFGSAVATAGDVNSDGFSDVIVGAMAYSPTAFPPKGAVFVYHGTSGGLETTPTKTLLPYPDQDFSDFGISVAPAGDVNGDGVSDVVVGANSYEEVKAGEGKVFVYHGVAGVGLGDIPDWEYLFPVADSSFGTSVAAAGDVDGDGYGDIVVGAVGAALAGGEIFVFRGSSTGIVSAVHWSYQEPQSDAQFGKTVSGAGDLNGDGYPDIVAGAFNYSNGSLGDGKVYAFYGSPGGFSSTPDWEFVSSDLAYLGNSVAMAGDVNGDGYADVIAGAPANSTPENHEGKVYLWLGSSAGLPGVPSWTWEPDIEAEAGRSVALAGDVNGDGFSDVIVGAPLYDTDPETDDGAAFVFHGSAEGLTAGSAWTGGSSDADGHFGFSVGHAGDVNGDGFNDVIVGAPGWDGGVADSGGVFVYHGSSSTILDFGWSTASDQGGSMFGHSVSGAGDVNGDGYSDVIVGAYFYDNVENDEGRAFVYHGSPAGLAEPAAWMAESNQAGARFGYSVSSAGDVNGDGYSDVIVGASWYDNVESNEGRACLYFGRPQGLTELPMWTAESNQANASFGYAVASSGDVNRDGFSDLVIGAPHYDNGQGDEGRVFVYHGSPGVLDDQADWHTESNQAGAWMGASVSGAGDVNGDGYSDLIVGTPLYGNGQPQEGAASVYHGSDSGPVYSGWWQESGQDGAEFGTSVSTAGDVDGDGYSEVIVGTRLYDNGSGTTGGGAFVYQGSSSGLLLTPDWMAEPFQANANFGVSVSTAGDVNGDGFDDVIVGASLYDDLAVDEGAALVYLGGNGAGREKRPRQALGPGETPVQLLGRVDQSTGAYLAVLARPPAGRTRARLIHEVRPLATSFDPVTAGSDSWFDTTLGSTDVGHQATSLAPGPHHWRVRLQYFPYLNYTRWYSWGPNAAGETDFRAVDTSCTSTGQGEQDCDGVDDDCDGWTDEDYISTTASCGVGACERIVPTYCLFGTEMYDCVPGQPAMDDSTCDGIDDDCDGIADEDACDNGQYCDGTETCDPGLGCLPGTDPCSGGSECNQACDEFDDNCYDPAGTECTDDGLFCTGPEQCDGAGSCVGTGDPCAPLVCNESDDTCGSCGDGVVTGPQEECDWGSPQNDHCCDPATCTWTGAGLPDPQGFCSGAGECQADVCNGSGVCQLDNLPAGTACTDDGLFCTGPESCDGAGSCVSGGNPCLESECNHCDEAADSCFDPVGTPCTDDGLFCTGLEECDGAGSCISMGNPCPETECNHCNEGDDNCFDPSGAACSDNGVYCDGEEACNGSGVCAGSGNPCPGNECNTCNEVAGNCYDEPGTPCTDDGLFCTGDEQCDGSGNCLSIGNPCPGTECNHCNETDDTCFDAQGTSCTSDGLFCTGTEECDGAGHCAGTGNPCPETECNHCNEDQNNCFDDPGTACTDDGQYCTGAEVCNGAGICQSAGDPCPGTECRTCNEGADNCADPAGTLCTQDGLYCTGAEECDGTGNCVSPGSPCPETDCNHCVEAFDNCQDPAGTPCTSDGLFCNGEEICDGSGACTSPGDPCLPVTCDEDNDICGACGDGLVTPPEVCDPGSPKLDNCCRVSDCLWVANGLPDPQSVCGPPPECNESVCDGGGGCKDVNVSNGTPCTNDGLFCNGNEECWSGFCTNTGNPCPQGMECNNCNEDANNCFDPAGTPCSDDGLFCTGVESCNGTGVCVGSGNPCLEVMCIHCNEDNDDCFDPAGTICQDDGLFCNGVEVCDGAGACASPGDPCPGTECNHCNEAANHCFDPPGVACTSDGQYCNGAEACDGTGACTSPGNPCLPETECRHCNETDDNCRDPIGTACTDDGEFCTGPETCNASGICQSAGDPCPGTQCNHCNEGDDSCFDPQGTLCQTDGLFCNGEEACDGSGTCISPGNPCLPESECNHCQEATNLCQEAAGTPCASDGLFCTGLEECDGAGSCESKGNPCEPAEECAHCNEDANNCRDPAGTACTDDGQYCNGMEFCNGIGECRPSNVSPCPETECQHCDEELDICFDPPGTPCSDDGLYCNGPETCREGVCQGRSDPCDDGNPCTDDPCDEQFDRCSHEPLSGTDCDNGLFCDGTDVCENGSCVTDGINPCHDFPFDRDCAECDEDEDTCTPVNIGGKCGNHCSVCNPDGSCVADPDADGHDCIGIDSCGGLCWTDEQSPSPRCLVEVHCNDLERTGCDSDLTGLPYDPEWMSHCRLMDKVGVAVEVGLVSLTSGGLQPVRIFLSITDEDWREPLTGLRVQLVMGNPPGQDPVMAYVEGSALVQGERLEATVPESGAGNVVVFELEDRELEPGPVGMVLDFLMARDFKGGDGHALEVSVWAPCNTPVDEAGCHYQVNRAFLLKEHGQDYEYGYTWVPAEGGTQPVSNRVVASLSGGMYQDDEGAGMLRSPVAGCECGSGGAGGGWMLGILLGWAIRRRYSS